MNPNYVIGFCIARDIMCKIFYFLICCSDLIIDLGRFYAPQFGDCNIHDNIKALQYSR